MASKATLQLDVFDVYGKRIAEKIDVMLRHRVLSDFRRVPGNGAKTIEVRDLSGDPQGLYQLDVDPPSYQSVSHFVNMKSSGITSMSLTLPIDPFKVTGVNFPAFSALEAAVSGLLNASAAVLSFTGKKGKVLYDALDPVGSGFFISFAKPDPPPATEKAFIVIQELTELRGDRFFAGSARFREETKTDDEGSLSASDSFTPSAKLFRSWQFQNSRSLWEFAVDLFQKGDDW